MRWGGTHHHIPAGIYVDPFGTPSSVKSGGVVRVYLLMQCLHNAVQRSVVPHCVHPTVPVDIWARCNSVSWDNSTLRMLVWIGIDSWLLWTNPRINSQATKLSYFCVETYS